MKAGKPKWVRRLLMMSRSASELALAAISFFRSSKNFMSSGGNRVVKERSTRSAGVLGIGVAAFFQAHYRANCIQKQVLLTLKTHLAQAVIGVLRTNARLGRRSQLARSMGP